MTVSSSETERVLRQAEASACEFIDFQFTDVAGAVKSVVLPTGQLDETLRFGHWFDGSALEGSARTMETDLLLRPDLATWGLLPWPGTRGERSGRLLCDVRTPEGQPFPADPRAVLRRLIADAADMGLDYRVASEVEFYLFRPRPGDARPRPDACRPVPGGVTLPSGAPPFSLEPLDRGGYFDMSVHQDTRIRDEMVQALSDLGVSVQASHHEIGPGQQEIDLPLLPALAAADAIVTCKFVVKAVARRRGLVATFMPKPLSATAGSGLHLHQALLRPEGADAMADARDEHGLSAAGKRFVAGQLAHGRAMCAVLAPTVNSYKRIGRGFDAPSVLVWGHTNPQAVVRVPRAAGRRVLPPRPGHGGARRAAPGDPAPLQAELRCPDPSCNPYLALAVALASGLDGIRAGLSLPAPVEPLAGGETDDPQVDVLPGSLGEAIGELEWDPVVRDALGAPVYERLLQAKAQEWEDYRRQVGPWELERYFESA
jgi:glutamine synthetase